LIKIQRPCFGRTANRALWLTVFNLSYLAFLFSQFYTGRFVSDYCLRLCALGFKGLRSLNIAKMNVRGKYILPNLHWHTEDTVSRVAGVAPKSAGEKISKVMGFGGTIRGLIHHIILLARPVGKLI
jgi:hypothetical protein